KGAPITTVLPSWDSATDAPVFVLTPPLNFTSCIQALPFFLNIHTAPSFPYPSFHAPMAATLPFLEMETEKPCCDPVNPTAPEPTNLAPTCDHEAPLRVKIQAAPASLLSVGPPTIAVFPSP